MAPNGDQVSTATVFSAEYLPKVTPKSKEDPTVIQRLLEQNAQDDQVEERRKVTPLKIVLENYKTPNECEGVFTPRIVSMKRKADMCSSMECPHCDITYKLRVRRLYKFYISFFLFGSQLFGFTRSSV